MPSEFIIIIMSGYNLQEQRTAKGRL